jgi:hypothetical protein
LRALTEQGIDAMTGFKSRLIYAQSTASNTAENRAVLRTHVRKPGHREEEVIGCYRRTTESVVVRFSSGESDEPLLNLRAVLPLTAREAASTPACESAEPRTHGKRIRQDADGRWSVEGWPEEIYEDEAIVEHLLRLELESKTLAAINRRIVQAGGKPIPTLKAGAARVRRLALLATSTTVPPEIDVL